MLVSARLRELLDGEGLKDTYDITPCKADLAAAVSPDYDLIVATSAIPDETSCPVIDGTPFLNDRVSVLQNLRYLQRLVMSLLIKSCFIRSVIQSPATVLNRRG